MDLTDSECPQRFRNPDITLTPGVRKKEVAFKHHPARFRLTKMSSGDTQTDDGYFNDLTRQPSLPQNGTESSPEQISTSVDAEEGGEAPRAKRVACVICRKRKLKCDGSKPKCGTCARLGHCCAYDEVRRKSGPKRGYVKELEARLGRFVYDETQNIMS